MRKKFNDRDVNNIFVIATEKELIHRPLGYG
jgi:hypothetical protein